MNIGDYVVNLLTDTLYRIIALDSQGCGVMNEVGGTCSVTFGPGLPTGCELLNMTDLTS